MRLADYARALEARTTLSLDNFLLEAIGEQYASDHRLSEFLRLALEKGACMVLLDGLDEVGDDPVRGRSLRTRVVQQVDRFAGRWCEDRCNRIIVTSRILYEIAAKTLIESWRQAQVGIPNALLAELGEETIIQIMAPLAYWLHEKRPGGTAPFEEWSERLVGILEERFEEDEAEAIAGRFLHHARYHAGLLAERGVGEFGFFHLTFEEYLAAREIARQREDKRREMLHKHWEDPRWHEVILLTAGQLGIIESRQDDVGHYIIELLHKEPVDPENVGRQVILAGRAVADIGLPNLKRRTRQWVQEALFETMQDRNVESKQLNEPPLIPIRTRFDAGLILDELRWLPNDLYGWVEVRSERFSAFDGAKAPTTNLYAMKYPVTNAQFERFIVARGYENKDWWSEDGWRWRVGTHPNSGGEGMVTEPRYWRTNQFGKERRGFPVVGVSWYEAEACANWLSDVLRRARANDTILPPEDFALVKELLIANAIEIRLPTHDEWLFMAGGVTNKDRYLWDPPQGPVTSKEEDITARCNTYESGIRTTSPVAMYPLGASRPFEIMDIGGNVWEWTDTQYEDRSDTRVVCGGSWYFNQDFARPSFHFRRYRYYSVSLIGFRLVSPIGF